MIIRAASESELSELFRIQLLALGLTDVAASIDPSETPSLYRHGIETGQTLVADEGGTAVGFAVGYERDGTWFLGEFFVHPEAQSSGIGQALLAELMPVGLPSATMTTSDPRAQAIYARFGLIPRWPSFNLRADVARLSLSATAVEAREAGALSPSFRAWDAAIAGRSRPQDLNFLRDDWNGALLWVEAGGQRIGYAGVAQRGAGRVTIGPVGARDGHSAEAAVIAAVHWAASQPEIASITIDIAGMHPALRSLLSSGFRIYDQNLFCASDAARFGDPGRYVPITPALF